jgi:hypothetical protein
MGLFTGISLVTFVEVTYWILRFIATTLFGPSGKKFKCSESRLMLSLINDISHLL